MKSKENKSLLLFKNGCLYYMYKTEISNEGMSIKMEMRKCKIFSFRAIKVIVVHLYNKLTKNYSGIGVV